MKEFLKGAMLGMVAGVCVGAIVVAKNKKLAGKLKSGLDAAETKLKEAKEDLKEKLECCDCDKDEKCQEFECEDREDTINKDFSKKTKNP